MSNEKQNAPERDWVDENEDLEALYSPEYLADCADEKARQERLEELKRRIALDSYDIDAERIAEELLARGDLS